jgi:hypothetical protein
MGTEPPTIVRTVMVYDTEAIGIQDDEKSKRMQIIDTIDEAETHLYDRKTALEGRENFILLETDWKTINNERDAKGLTKITNDKLRTGYVNEDKDYATLKQEVQEAESWLKLVKKYGELHELPVGKAPWEKEETGEVYIETTGSEFEEFEGENYGPDIPV